MSDIALRRRPKCAMCGQPHDAAQKRDEAVTRAQNLEREMRLVRLTCEAWEQRALRAEAEIERLRKAAS